MSHCRNVGLYHCSIRTPVEYTYDLYSTPMTCRVVHLWPWPWNWGIKHSFIIKLYHWPHSVNTEEVTPMTSVDISALHANFTQLQSENVLHR